MMYDEALDAAIYEGLTVSRKAFTMALFRHEPTEWDKERIVNVYSGMKACFNAHDQNAKDWYILNGSQSAC